MPSVLGPLILVIPVYACLIQLKLLEVVSPRNETRKADIAFAFFGGVIFSSRYNLNSYNLRIRRPNSFRFLGVQSDSFYKLVKSFESIHIPR